MWIFPNILGKTPIDCLESGWYYNIVKNIGRMGLKCARGPLRLRWIFGASELEKAERTVLRFREGQWASPSLIKIQKGVSSLSARRKGHEKIFQKRNASLRIYIRPARLVFLLFPRACVKHKAAGRQMLPRSLLSPRYPACRCVRRADY